MESRICSIKTCDFTLLNSRKVNHTYKHKKPKNDINTIEIIQRVLSTRKDDEKDEVATYDPSLGNLSPEFIRKKLKRQLEKYPPLEMPDHCIHGIFKRIPNHLYKDWGTTCDVLLDELKQEFQQSTTKIILGMTVLIADDIKPSGEKFIKMSDKVSSRSNNVVTKKNILEGNILYYYPFIRHLIEEAQKLLPPVFIDCSKYSEFKGFYHPEILLSMMEKEIDREDLRMEFDWFGKLFMHISEKEFFLDWSDSKVSRFINLIIQITKTIALERIYDTLRTLVQFFTDPKTTPKIAVQVYHSFNGQIVIIPTAADIYGSYCNLIRRVYDMGKNFAHFEMFHLKKGRRGYICLEKYDNIKNMYETKIKEFVIGIYKKMTDHYSQISEKYMDLIDESQTNYEKLSSMNMEELIAMADHYITIKGLVNEIELNTYFPHFKANNKAMIKALLFITECRTDQIMNEVLKFHVEYCERNCEEFSNVSKKAVKVPEETEELISLAKFMKFVSTDHMIHLRSAILSYLELFYRVMEIVTVPQSYLDMMGLVLGWVSYMESVIKQNSSMLEVSKTEFEECLNKVTEKLNEDLENFSSELDGLDHLDDYSMINSYTLHIMKCLRKVQHFDETAKWINKEESLFEMTLSTYPELDEIKAFVNPFAKLIFKLYKWNMVYQTIMDGSLEKLTLEDVESTLEEYNDLIYQLQKWFKSKIRQQANENNPRRFKGNVDDSEYDNWPAPLKLLHGAQKNLDEIKDHKSFIRLLCNPRMTAKHWESISTIAQRDMTPYKGSSLRQFINFNVHDKMDQFEAISESAIKEYHLKENLVRMKEEWGNVHFNLKKSSNIPVAYFESVDYIQSLIDSHLVKTLSIRSSSFVKPIEEDLKAWYSKLKLLNTTIEECCRVQIQWLYFLPIFSSSVILEQMQIEGILFKEVDESYRALLSLVQKNTLVISILDNDSVLPVLKACLLKFEQINIGVKKYLEKKRLFFARLYFLSDEQMLQFLSETKDPKKAQKFLKKCFTGISQLGYDNLLNIKLLISSQNEKIRLTNKISILDADGSVEKWLVQVEDQMIISVRDIMKQGFNDFETKDRQVWIHRWPGQIVLCVSQLYWVCKIHVCFANMQKEELQNIYQHQMDQINLTISCLKGKLPMYMRTTLTSLVILDVHCKDVTYNLYKKSVSSPLDFLWLSQIRYYFEDDLTVRILNIQIKYSYEYLGSSPRLVMTPLTERCYRTLIGAYSLHYFGAPEGPSSTGKTETIKDLAAAIAIYCHVFNCTSSTDFTTFDKFLKGIASSGVWICFHEFDRINVNVLSVIAQQMSCITQAIRQHKSTFIFNETSLALNPSCFVCITMNPGYLGRSELPSNLKALFRPVAMVVPDFSLIGEVFLLSNGFQYSRKLSLKTLNVMKLCLDTLPHSGHYDFGLRTLMTIWKMATMKKVSDDETEEAIIMKSITDIIKPRIPESCTFIFTNIIHDTFVNAVEQLPTTDLLNAILGVCIQRNLQPIDKFVHKVYQANELMLVNHSIMFIGEPFSGKSTVLKVLEDVHTLLGKNNDVQICLNVINPKAVSIEQLYGSFNESHEWTDGIIGKTFREFSDNFKSQKNWVLFDGPIISKWVEDFNTGLDDKRMLCLHNGEIIEIMFDTTIIFESTELLEASPATISRCGIIYFESKSLGWEAILKSWNETLPKEWKSDKPDRFLQLLLWLIPLCTEFISKHCRMAIHLGTEHLVRSVCHLIEIMLFDALDGQDLKYLNSWSQAVVLQSVLWCFAGNLDKNSKEKFDVYYRRLWQTDENEIQENKFGDEIDIVLPNDGLIEDNAFIYKGKGAWKFWPEVLKMLKYDDIYNPRTNLVSTVDSLKYSAILELLIKYEKPFLLLGLPGTGKTSFLKNLLLTSSNEKFSPSYLSFTASTTVSFIQEIILSKLIKKKKGVYGPSGNQKCLMFIDDINMLEKENDSQSSLELIRQFFDHGYWYDMKYLGKIYLEDLIFIAAMSLQCENNHTLPMRFLRHFVHFSINPFSDDSLTKIFTTIVFLGLRKNGFPADVMNLTQQVILSTLTIYNSAVNKLLPTPCKCHYIFSVRDIMRVYQGFLLIRKDSADGKKAFIRLWVHEILRVFYDRLIEENEKDWLFEKIRKTVEECFKEEFDLMLDGLNENDETLVTRSSLSNLIFTTAFDVELQEHQKYDEVISLESFYNLAHKMLEEFNAKAKNELNIILFKYALEHMAHICRVMSVPFGNGALIGVNGTGRQSLVKLSAFMLRQTVYQPETSKDFDYNGWKNDIKTLLKVSGAENKQCIILLSQSQLKLDYIMQDINSFLNTGEIPNLFALNEMQDIVEMLRYDIQANENTEVNTYSVFEHFVSCCRKNLHILLCINSANSEFRLLLRKFPSIVNICTLDWFEAGWTLNINGKYLQTAGWPEEALERVAKEYLADVELEESLKEQIVNICKYFHVSARLISNEFDEMTGRKTCISSASYINLLELYRFWFKKKRDELELSKERYLGGLEKLEFAACQVEIMQIDLESLQPALKKAAEETTEMLKVIETETYEVEKASERVRLDEEIANEQAMGAMELKTECENDLALAIPILEDAVAALNTLKPADITLVKSMKNPPETVKLVLAAVCVMKGIKPDRLPDPKNPGRRINDYWGPSKRLLGDMSFLQQLKDYDKDNIPATIMKAVRLQYLNHKDFKPKVVAKASSAAEGLCKWVIALDKYDVVVKEVAPKKEKLRIAEKEYSETMAILEEKRNLLKGLEDKLAELKENLKEANERKIRLQDEVVLCSNKLRKAQRIIGSLGGEKERWEEVAEDLKKQSDEIPGNILLSCSIIAYLSSFSPEFRNSTLADWCTFSYEIGIPLSSEYSLPKVLGSSVQIEQWILCGLPNDSFSIENAVILVSSERWPLLLDPQNQGNKWIRNMEANNGLKIVRSIEKNINTIQVCLELGYPLLFENLQELCPLLHSILKKHSFSQEPRQYFIQENVINVHKNFRFYITTNLCNPHYLPDLHKVVTIINFSLTLGGLADQLLEILVAKERPEVQEKRQILLLESSKNKKDLQAVEDEILKTLSSVIGNILEDESAVNSLDMSKAIAEEIKVREAAAKKARDDIEQFQQGYKSVGDHCASLYYTITNLCSLDPMYQYSLSWYIKIFKISIDSAMEGKLDSSEIDLLFAKNNMDTSIEHENPVKEWLPNKIWNAVCRIDLNPSFQNFREDFVENIDQWKILYFKQNLSSNDVHIPWFKKLSSLKKTILLSTVRPDRLLSEISLFVKNEIGERFIHPSTFGLRKVFEESDNKIPLIIISSPGSDPMQTLISFVKKNNKLKKFISFSMGNTKNLTAEWIIDDAKKTGMWICLQNCHLALSWISKLENILVSTNSSFTSPDFRVWLTTNSCSEFPASILQNGVKIINEEPDTLKENILLRYISEPLCDLSFYESCPGMENMFSRLLYAITFFHGVVCERKKFGPVGWNIPYWFDENDYLTSIFQLQMFVGEYEKSSIEPMLYLIGECNYGGKVTDQWDKRILNVLIQEFINEEIIQSEKYSIIRNNNLYYMPVKNDYKDFIHCIQNLPTVSDPDIFGLNSNAGFIYDLKLSGELIKDICTFFGFCKPNEHKDAILQNILENILTKIPEFFDIDEAMKKYPPTRDDCLTVILFHEMTKLNEILKVINETVSDLLKAMKGFSKLSKEMEIVSFSLLINEVPQAWIAVSYPTLKLLGSYLNDFSERNSFLQDWYKAGSLMDYWLPGFCYPQAFLTGIIQNYSRKHNILLDDIEFDYEFLKEDRATDFSESGTKVYGIYLDCASWNRTENCLEEEYPMLRFNKLPLLDVKPKLKHSQISQEKYVCPLYIRPTRKGDISTFGNSRNYITSVLVMSKENPSHWIKRGAAMTCQIIE